MFAHARYLPWKRFMDIVAAAVLLVLAAPLMLILALLVRLTSRGPALHTQDRLGRYGQPFGMWSLRTLTVESAATAAAPAMMHEPRLTAVGRVLRSARLDELPQLWNVLKGDMSLVGPRPERPEFMPILESSITDYRQRLLVRPGLTGLAQVCLPPDTGIPSMRKKIKYDLFYIRSMGGWLDLRLVLGRVLRVCGMPRPLVQSTLCLPPAAVIEQRPLSESRPPSLPELPVAAQPQPLQAQPKVMV